MHAISRIRQRTLYALVFFSGASGLIYEVVWHKYLAILLGGQARATAITLAIFLGGISLGYALFGRWSRTKNWNLIFTYALIELGLAVWAMAFPAMFHFVFARIALLYQAIGLTNLAVDFSVSILLVGIPTFLMGGTLPLLTQGLSNDLDESSQTHAKIYGFNTVGGCVGCLAAGYYLVPRFGLSVACTIGAMFNLAVAVAVYFGFQKMSVHHRRASSATRPHRLAPLTRDQGMLLGIAFLSGFYLITLETVLIRLMGLAIGASNYNFTLIVALFIFCLGAASLFTRRISEYPPTRLFWNQVALAFTLYLLYMSGDYWSYWLHVIRATLRDIPENFFFHQALVGIGMCAVLIIPIGLAGFTIPLCFHLIKDEKETLGHRVGQLYSVNTLGCVLGALIGGYALFNYFDLDQLLKICVVLAVLTAAGAGYLCYEREGLRKFQLVFAAVLLSVTTTGVLFAPRYNHDRFIQPFRHPAPIAATFHGAEEFGRYLGRSTEFLYWKDGPNTSVGIGMSRYQDKEVSRTIFVNGKSDGNTRGDFFTTVMLAHIPALLTRDPARACVIGFGTGTTVGALAAYPQIKSVDVAEISNTILDNRVFFDTYNGHVSTDPKVTIHEMDAFRFLGGTADKFNIIVSEPSNPWVAGIENLYSSEFYQTALDKLAPDGMFVQWIHTYSFNDELFKMVLRTMGEKFATLSVFQLKGGDLALVGTREPVSLEAMSQAALNIRSTNSVRQALDEAGVPTLESILALEVVTPPLAKRIGDDGGYVHSLESPKLSNEAAKAFFVGSSTKVQVLRRQYKEYYQSIDSSLLSRYLGSKRLTPELLTSFRESFCENAMSKTPYLCEETLALARFSDGAFRIDNKYDDFVATRDLSSLDALPQIRSKGFNADDLQQVYKMFEGYKKYASPIARVPTDFFLNNVQQCLSSAKPANELYGECLLQKILVLETLRPATTELKEAIGRYLDWFPILEKSAPNYTKLEEARTILLKMTARRD